MLRGLSFQNDAPLDDRLVRVAEVTMEVKQHSLLDKQLSGSSQKGESELQSKHRHFLGQIDCRTS